MLKTHPIATLAGLGLLLLLALAPLATETLGLAFWLDVINRTIILAIAAVSLNFILGYGGMVSFGHAAFIGLGAYAVGIPAHYDLYSGFLHLLIVVLGCGAFALITGAISLRTKGVHFIMITMAFGQMAYYAFISMEEYGGDDGLVIYARSEFPILDIEQRLVFYYTCLASLIGALYLVHRMVNSRFGMVIKGAKSNERRMAALGFPAYRYRLAAYVISGMMCGFAGALLGNYTSFISPEMMGWTRSGELIFMVVLGGAGTLFGPLFGVVAFLLIEEVLSGITTYWHIIFGAILVLVVLFAKGGISGLLTAKRPALGKQPAKAEPAE